MDEVVRATEDFGRTLGRMFDVPLSMLQSGLEARPAPPVTVESINRMMQRIYDAGLPRQPRLEFRYGEGVPEQLTASIEMHPRRPGEPELNAIYGIPMIPDASLAPGEWRIVDEFGNVRCLNNPALGVAVVLPTDLMWNTAHDRFMRVEREGGSLLDRIDAEVEAWETGDDAYRYKPGEALTD